MKEYHIFSHPSGEHEAVKQGWSWPAFFFGFIWAFVKKMWQIGLGVILGFMALGMFLDLSNGQTENDVILNILSLLVAVVFGLNGNRWRVRNLTSRGYEMKMTLISENPEMAIAEYIKEQGR